MREMKDSGIEWIGDIPVDWSVVRIGTQYTERKTKVSDREYPPLSVTMKGVLPQLATAAKTDAHDDRKLVCKGDFAINSRSDRRGSCGISPSDGSVSLINTILCPRDKMDPQYYDWLFHSTMFSDEFYKWGHGIVDDLWTTNWQDMKRISIPEPSLDEQKKIADFLDKKCAEIDAVIEKTKATIEEYKKLKQSIITETVTKGIRGNRPMKDSGIEWIGKVASDREIIRMKFFTYMKGRIGWQGLNSADFIDDGPYCITGTDFKNGYVNWDTCYHVSEERYEMDVNIQVKEGDLLITKDGTIGKLAIIDKLLRHACLNSHLLILRPLMNKYTNHFLYYVLSSNIFKHYYSLVGSGKTTMASLSQEQVGEFSFPCPNLKEQQEIVNFLDGKCAEIDKLISDKTYLLEELEQYKKSVIYEYVTGKKTCSESKEEVTVIYPYFPAVLNTDKARFAQAVLMSRILDKNNKGMGRVKLEKMLFTIEHSIGFDFDTEYIREAAGPLDTSLYKCENIVSKINKWYLIKASKYGVSYSPTKKKDEYKKYYEKFFSSYDSEIQHIIDVFKDFNADQAEIFATLFGAWNDFIIDKKQFTDDDIVNEVLNNWHDSKKRFDRSIWLRAIQAMRKNNIVPKGYGKRTVKKVLCDA